MQTLRPVKPHVTKQIQLRFRTTSSLSTGLLFREPVSEAKGRAD